MKVYEDDGTGTERLRDSSRESHESLDPFPELARDSSSRGNPIQGVESQRLETTKANVQPSKVSVGKS